MATPSLRALLRGPLPVTAPLVLNPLMAKMVEAAGFAAIEIEDQLVPKRAHHHVGIEHMIPMELMAANARGLRWKKVYAALAHGFAANVAKKPDWSPVEKDMLAPIDIEKLLAVERRTVERG